MYDIYVNQEFLRTPLGNPIEVPTLELAKAIEEEWTIDKALHYRKKPMTSLVATALDCVVAEQDKYVAEVIEAIQTDAVLYWVESPKSLVELQDKEWLPIIAQVNQLLGLSLKPIKTFAVEKLTRSEEENLKAFLYHLSAFTLAGILHLIQLTGSFCLSYLIVARKISPRDAWRIVHLHEREQEKTWGADHEDQAKAEDKEKEFNETIRFLNLLPKPEGIPL